MATGGGLCTAECKAFTATVVNFPTAYLTSQTTMHAIMNRASSMLKSAGMSTGIADWVQGLPSGLALNTNLPTIAATQLPECMCGVDYVSVYNLVKPVVISALQDSGSFSSNLNQITWYTDKLTTWAAHLTGASGLCTDACKQGLEAVIMHWTEVAMLIFGNGGLESLGLRGYTVTATAITTPLMGCACQPETTFISSLKTTLDALQPLLTSTVDQTLISSLLSSFKTNLKATITAMVGTDSFCSTQCQDAAYNGAKLGHKLEKGPQTSSLTNSLQASYSVPASIDALIEPLYTNAMPCLCASTTDPSAAVDAIWTPIVETLTSDLSAVAAGTVPTGQQVSAMAIAAISAPASMGMCASTECKALLTNVDTLVTEMHSTVLSGTAPTATCSATQAAACITDPTVLSAATADAANSAVQAKAECAISGGLSIAPLWWISCGVATGCSGAMDGGAAAYVASAEMVISADLSDYDSDTEKAPLITSFAQSVGAAVEDVTLTVEAVGSARRGLSVASVKLTFEVITKSEVAKASFENTMTAWTAAPTVASAALGVTVTSTTLLPTVTVAPPPSMPPPSPAMPPPPPPDSSGGIDVAVIGGAVGGAVVVLCCVCALVAFLLMKKGRKGKVQAT